MRALALLLLIVSFAFSQEEETRPTPTPEHDEIGLPVTFNAEIITRADLIRRINAPVETLGPGAIRDELVRALLDRVDERVGELWNIRIEESQVEEALRREIEVRGGEAKFYRHLDQIGTTLPRFQQDLRLKILKAHINFMLTRGYTPDQTMLPWEVKATPEEIKIAFEHDKERRAASARVRGLEVNLDVDIQALMRELGMGAEVRTERRKRVEALVSKVLGELEEGRPFAEVAAEQGVDVETAGSLWRPLPSSEAQDPLVRFYQTAKPGSWSQPIWQSSGACVIAYLIEVDRPGAKGIANPDVNRAYRERIHALRRQKAEALMRLRALGESTLRPEMVRRNFRKFLLASLREARIGLRALGLH